MSFINQVVEFCKVIASSVGGINSATLYNLTGIAGFEDESDEAGEQAHEQEAYTSLGIIGRPLPAEGDAFAEAISLRTDDGLIPFAFRDLRLHRAVNPGGAGTTPREGQLMFVGYGGAFLSHAMTSGAVGSKRGNVTTLYVPYDFDANGVPQKAHAISIDPSDGNSSVSIVHGDGIFFSLTEDAGAGSPGIVWSVDGATFGRVSAGEFMVNAQKIMLRGNVYVGRTPEAGVQLLGGPISPPCPSFYVSPV